MASAQDLVSFIRSGSNAGQDSFEQEMALRTASQNPTAIAAANAGSMGNLIRSQGQANLKISGLIDEAETRYLANPDDFNLGQLEVFNSASLSIRGRPFAEQTRTRGIWQGAASLLNEVALGIPDIVMEAFGSDFVNPETVAESRQANIGGAIGSVASLATGYGLAGAGVKGLSWGSKLIRGGRAAKSSRVTTGLLGKLPGVPDTISRGVLRQATADAGVGALYGGIDHDQNYVSELSAGGALGGAAIGGIIGLGTGAYKASKAAKAAAANKSIGTPTTEALDPSRLLGPGPLPPKGLPVGRGPNAFSVDEGVVSSLRQPVAQKFKINLNLSKKAAKAASRTATEGGVKQYNFSFTQREFDNYGVRTLIDKGVSQNTINNLVARVESSGGSEIRASVQTVMQSHLASLSSESPTKFGRAIIKNLKTGNSQAINRVIKMSTKEAKKFSRTTSLVVQDAVEKASDDVVAATISKNKFNLPAETKKELRNAIRKAGRELGLTTDEIRAFDKGSKRILDTIGKSGDQKALDAFLNDIHQASAQGSKQLKETIQSWNNQVRRINARNAIGETNFKVGESRIEEANRLSSQLVEGGEDVGRVVSIPDDILGRADDIETPFL